MGTSASSVGPNGKVPLVPPWVPPIELLYPNSEEQNPEQGQQSIEHDIPKIEQPTLSLLAPPRRFAAARTSLGHFANKGNRINLQSALGHYTRTGLSGSGNATRRMAGTVRTAGNLYNVLHALRSDQAGRIVESLDVLSLAGLSTKEVCDRIIEVIRPIDGTQDSEASRNAINDAIADLLDAQPDADLKSLSEEQINYIIETFVAYDLCQRIELDIGKVVLDKAPDHKIGVHRLEQIKEYIKEIISQCFRTQYKKGEKLNQHTATILTARVLQSTFEVFEEFIL